MPPQPFTYNLPGPRTYTYDEILELVSSLTYNPRSSSLALPKSLAMFIARIAQLAWFPLISPDEVVRRYIHDKNESEAPGDWEKLGVEPEAIELHAIKFLRQFRLP